MSKWLAYDEGRSVGGVGPEGSVTLRDEEYSSIARATIKRGNDYISVSCKVYGWMDHTRFFKTVSEAQREYVLMRRALMNMVENILLAGESNLKMWEAIAEFVRRFP